MDFPSTLDRIPDAMNVGAQRPPAISGRSYDGDREGGHVGMGRFSQSELVSHSSLRFGPERSVCLAVNLDEVLKRIDAKNPDER